jgi:membrane protease YdiL (CAAX protease family)
MTLNLGAYPLILILLSLFDLLFIFIPTFISSRFSKKPVFSEIKELGFYSIFRNYKHFLIHLMFGLLFGVLLFFISGFILSLIINYLFLSVFGIEFLQEGINNAISTQPFYPSPVELTILIIIQIIIIGPCEEAFFRGFLITKFNYKIKIIYSILLSSLLFTFYHTPPFLVPFSTIITFFPYYFVIGLFLALIYIKFNRSLIPCCIAHSLFNILILLY